MMWSLVLNLKPSGKKFEQRMKVNMIIERIIKTLSNSKIIASFKLVYTHGLVSGITSLSMILLRRPDYLLLAGLAKSQVLKKYFCFYREVYFSFFTNWVCKLWKDVNSFINHSLKSSLSHLNY